MGISLANGISEVADLSTQQPAGTGKGGGMSQPGLYSMPTQSFQMQPQQYTQVPYAQQYAQQGNINDPTVFAALQALNSPAYIAQPTQRYGSGIMEQSGAGKGGAVGSAPMIQDWRSKLPPPPANVVQQVLAGYGGDGGGGYSSGYDTSSGFFGGVGGVGGPASTTAANAADFGGADTGYGGGYDSSGQGTNADGGYGAGGFGQGDNFGGF